MKLRNRLCSLAYSTRTGENPDACLNCSSPCEYGRQWLRELGMGTPQKAAEPLYVETLPYHNTRRLQFLNRR